MSRYLSLIAFSACIVAGVGCDGGPGGVTPPPPAPPPPPAEMVTVELGGRVVDAEAGDPIEGVRVSVDEWNGSAVIRDTATSAGDGTFIICLNLPVNWRFVNLKLTAPPGHDDTHGAFLATMTQCFFGPCWTPADRPAIRMYRTLVIRPGESIDVRVDDNISWCGWDGYSCRRVLVAASPGESVELEVVSHNSSQAMALGLAVPTNPYNLEPDISVRRLVVPPGGVPFVIAEYANGIATLTARR